MVRVAIVGGGFAGLSAARKLGRVRGIELTLIDPRQNQHFLPMLPDIIGRNVRPESLSYPLVHAAERWSCQVVTAAAHDIDLDKRHVHCAGGTVAFDYMILAAGARTTFFGQTDIRSHALTLDSVDDATRIKRGVSHHTVDTVVICGAGYTGLEIATNLWRLCKQESLDRNIVLVDLANTPIPGLKSEFQTYAAEQIRQLGITFRPETTVQNADENGVQLDDGTRFEDAVLIWSPGVESADVVQQLPVEKVKQKRLKVNPDLSFAEGCYAAGDAAGFMHRGNLLRPSVQFAISQGIHAARNVRRDISGQPTKPFKPFDPGYVVPLGHGRGCGVVLGAPIRGQLPYHLHYLMCWLRSFGVANRGALIRDLWRSRGRTSPRTPSG